MNRTLLAMAALLAGCSSVTPVTSLGNDTYIVGSKTTKPGRGHTDMKIRAVKQAQMYCQKIGRTMVVESTKSSGAPGWTAVNGEVIFKCVPTSDTGPVALQPTAAS